MSQSIFRVIKDKNNPYSMINRFFTLDARLSYKAMGVLTYLLTKPDNWKVRVSDLSKRHTDGPAAVKAALRELEEHGYIHREAIRVKGKIKEHVTYVYETPMLNPRVTKTEDQIIAEIELLLQDEMDKSKDTDI